MKWKGRRQSENYETLPEPTFIDKVGFVDAWLDEKFEGLLFRLPKAVFYAATDKLGLTEKPDTTMPPLEEMFAKAAEQNPIERDINNDKMGVEAGQQTRISIDDNGYINTRASKDKSRSDLALDIILSTVEYDKLFTKVDNRAIELRSRGETLQNRIESVLTRENTAMQNLLDNAVTLPNGKKAFLQSNGEAKTIDGTPIDPALVEGIDWAGRPTWNEYQAQNERVQAVEGIASANDGLLSDIGEVQDRLADEDRPNSDELEGFGESLDNINDGFGSLDAQLNEFESVLPNVRNDVSFQQNVEIPKLD